MKYVVLCLALTACAAPTAFEPAYIAPAATHKWFKAEDVKESQVTKIETDLASEFCTAVIGTASIACAVRMAGLGRCVIVIQPGAGVQAAHEAGGHCMGYDHK